MRITSGIRGLQAISILVLVFSFIIIVPSFASADEVAVQTAQLLPVGANTCAAASVSGFTPYVYNSSLHAFEFTVADSSYVAIAATVGGVNIPFNQMTRLGDGSGSVRIHADLQSMPVDRGLPVSVTMLSAKGSGQPVCITVVATTVTPEGELSLTPSAPTPIPTPKPAASPVSTTAPKPAPAPIPSPVSPATTSTVGKPTTATSAAFATTESILNNMCTGTGADRLWFVLLAVFAAIVAFAAFGRSQLPPALRTQEWTAASIVVPFLLLFGLWYFVESCRTTPLVPVIATIIALVGLGIAFWERGATRPTPSQQTVINLPGAKK